MRPNRTAQLALFSIVLLFFLQVLSDFIQSIYALELLVVALTIRLTAVLVLLTPLILLFVRRPPSRPWIVGLASVAMLGRLLEPMLDPRGRLVLCAISVGAFMLLFPILVASRPPGSIAGWRLASGLLIAVMTSIFFRTAGSGLDISEVGIYQFIAWALGVLAGRLILSWEAGIAADREQQSPTTPPVAGNVAKAASYDERREQSLRALEIGPKAAPPAALGVPPRSDTVKAPSTARVLGLCIGLVSVIILIYFAFANPMVIARWTGYSFLAILCVLVAALLGFALSFSSRWMPRVLSRPTILIWNGLFVLMLVLTILPHQVRFPASPEGYPLDVSAPSPAGMIPLLLMLLLSPVIFVDFMLYARELSAQGASVRQLGGGFALAALFLLVMIFLHVFTTIYDYAAPIGPLFRDRFWLVYLIAGLALALPMLLVPAWGVEKAPVIPAYSLTAPIIAVLAIASIGASLLARRSPNLSEPQIRPVRVMTYNIQQGFDKVGHSAPPAQLAAMQRVLPDILGLQESDTARTGTGNVDVVRYFADRLGMYSYYGPTTTTGTFGIALLSKYPIREARTFYMYSTGEQTAAIQAQINAGGKTYNVFVTHLGNGGPMIQLQEVLQRVQGLPNVILMGDFNFDPSTPQYALAQHSLADAWLLRWPTGYQVSGPGVERRIDLILVSPGAQVLDAEYVADPSSDHPYHYAVISP